MSRERREVLTWNGQDQAPTLLLGSKNTVRKSWEPGQQA